MRDLVKGEGAPITPLNYLFLWLGIVGNCVGLALPLEIVQRMA